MSETAIQDAPHAAGGWVRPVAWLRGAVFALGILAIGFTALSRAVPYALPAQASLRAGELARSFESHYDQVFPVKDLGTNLWAAIQLLLFGEGRNGVIVGRSGWLYTQEEFRGWPDASRRIEAQLDLIAAVDAALRARGSELVVALVPAKARLYPEHLGERKPEPLHHHLYSDIRLGLLERGLAAPDLYSALRDCKAQEQVFLRTDTHWTPAGARCAAGAIAASIGRAGLGTTHPTPYLTHLDPARPHRGDLLNFLPLDPYFGFLLPPPDRIAEARTEPVEPPDLFAEAPPPRVALVGTSYSANAHWNFDGALKQALSEDVLNLAESGHGPFAPMLAYLRGAPDVATPPRLVIWEIPERYVPAEPPHDPAQLQAPPQRQDVIAPTDDGELTI